MKSILIYDYDDERIDEVYNKFELKPCELIENLLDLYLDEFLISEYGSTLTEGVNKNMKKLNESDLVEKTTAEIEADKQAWLDRKKRNSEKGEIARREFRQATDKVLAPIEEYLRTQLKMFNKLEFDITVDRAYRSKAFNGDTVLVVIRCNERMKFDKNSALAWNYEVYIDSEGNAQKESGSWSGLQACTQEQLESLKQTVNALELLNELDWKKILNVTLPSYDMLIYDKEDETPEYDYDVELNAQAVRELIGQGKAIRIKNTGDRGYDLYIVPIRETNKKFEVVSFSAYYIDNNYTTAKELYDQYKRWPEPLLKSKITVVKPLNIIDVE